MIVLGGTEARPGILPGDCGVMLAIGAVSSNKHPAGTQADFVGSDTICPAPSGSFWTNHHPLAFDMTTKEAPLKSQQSHHSHSHSDIKLVSSICNIWIDRRGVSYLVYVAVLVDQSPGCGACTLRLTRLTGIRCRPTGTTAALGTVGAASAPTAVAHTRTWQLGERSFARCPSARPITLCGARLSGRSFRLCGRISRRLDRWQQVGRRVWWETKLDCLLLLSDGNWRFDIALESADTLASHSLCASA